MTDRFNTLTVVLEKDMRDDDAERLLDAIRCMRCVLSVDGNVANPSDYMAEERVKRDLSDKLWQVLHPK